MYDTTIYPLGNCNMVKRLKLWYRGGKHLNGEVVYNVPHWSARLVRHIVSFVSLEWKWLLGFLVLIIGILFFAYS